MARRILWKGSDPTGTVDGLLQNNAYGPLADWFEERGHMAPAVFLRHYAAKSQLPRRPIQMDHYHHSYHRLRGPLGPVTHEIHLSLNDPVTRYNYETGEHTTVFDLGLTHYTGRGMHNVTMFNQQGRRPEGE